MLNVVVSNILSIMPAATWLANLMEREAAETAYANKYWQKRARYGTWGPTLAPPGLFHPDSEGSSLLFRLLMFWGISLATCLKAEGKQGKTTREGSWNAVSRSVQWSWGTNALLLEEQALNDVMNVSGILSANGAWLGVSRETSESSRVSVNVAAAGV